VDDYDTIELLPLTPITSSSWLGTALVNFNFTVENGWFLDWSNAHPENWSVSEVAWVVTSPAFTDPAGNDHNRDIVKQDAGGVNFQLSYEPQAPEDPPVANVHFLQVLDWTYGWDSQSYEEIWVDNGMGGPVNGSNPFYDLPQPGQEAGIHGITDGAAWMYDTPYDEELEREDFWACNLFQTFLAVDNFANGTHTVTLYGGIEWGYTYSTSDVPEPASLGLLGLGGLAIMRRRRQGN
jgi:hypothetical protein